MLVLNFIFVIVTLSQSVLMVDIKKLYYEKDLSEYCKRRVIPSIFLGRHVVEASSFILHFTKLNLPYSCFISIRSESGSSMIMVLKLLNDAGLEAACADHSPQLFVYEMGETFGGYWGMLPEYMLKQRPPITKLYTLKTTQPTTKATEPSTEDYEETTTFAPTPQMDAKETQEYIRVEVPIVDVSAKLVPGSEQPTVPFAFEEAFDYLYDVTPIPGVKYETSILPLVQLSVRKQTDDGRRDEGQEPRYEVDVVEDFTPDPRLTLPRFTLNPKQRTHANRRLSFGKNRAKKTKLRKMSATKINKYSKYIFPATMINNKTISTTRNSWDIIEQLVETLKKSKNDKEYYNKEQNEDDRKTKLLIAENISNLKHNFSIYLQPNLSIYNDKKSSNLFTTKPSTSHLLSRSTDSFRKLTNIHTETEITTAYEKQATKNILSTTLHQISTINATTKTSSNKDISSEKQTNAFSKTTHSSSKTSSIASHTTSTNGSKEIDIEMDSPRIVTTNKPNKISVSEIPITIPQVSLVDHESWENIVQAAPGMAVLLNKTMPYNVNASDDWSSLNVTHRKKPLERNKRAIQSIEIDSGRPHNLTTKARASITTSRAFDVEDMQEFASLVELKDDEIYGRVALRYLKQYVGPTIYNICSDNQLLNRHVYLFNSSRIVLSLNNFTLGRMSVILTRARTLLSSEMVCLTSQLECQVSGARVCVDSLAACDGVPNCGSYDIYDEDRLMCGVALGLQRNVYLAAFTFLALLLTLFYAVHYWLNRCVPKVADAFFVYQDGVENILYLDSIMRPPGEYDDNTRIFYRGTYNGDVMLNPEFIDQSEKSLLSKLCRKCFFCFRKKEKEHEDEDGPEHEMITAGQRKTYSFMQMELYNMSVRPKVDTSVQTGDSLEMTIFDKQSELQVSTNKKYSPHARTSDEKDESCICKPKYPYMVTSNSLLTLDEPLPEEELSLMKFFRDNRSDHSESILMTEKSQTHLDFSTGAAPDKEMELSNVMYDGGMKMRPGTSGMLTPPKVKPKAKPTAKSTAKPMVKPSRTRKKIRFDEATTMIPPNEFSDDDDDEEIEYPKGHAIPTAQSRSWRSPHLSTIKEDDESESKHRRFWESKGKKSKKGNTISLR